ncbi:LOW QUALITY PROTEIN: acidic mammalian chitinase-like [Trichechus manatus latirostris]|uniref:LOW QUALITY PROTEIN: acidic mammalian chitinase-like n=1 Tax=Trichechus manatus latirostris TaxID=127582 RepID=A0A2Y9G1H3_TRIMA|nr:LOW QUALITY PROTEIN: acidic mammalian chitinase-like [Trichechus manatus latirostris]
MSKLLILAGLALLLQLGTATKIVCYFTSWSQYHPGIVHYMPENVDLCLSIQIIYAFAGMANNQIKTIEWNDEALSVGINSLKNYNTEQKALLSVGGWNFGTQGFSNMVTIAENHQTFIQSAIQFLKKYNFDGLDIDWQYPGNHSSPADTQQLFTVLLQEMYEAFEQEAFQSNKPRLLISAVVSAGKGTTETAYQIPEMSRYMNLINLMTYDLRGSWEDFTGEDSPLFAGPNDQGVYKYFNAEYAINYWKNQGVPAEKLMVGFGACVRTLTLTNPAHHGLDDPTSDPGTAGAYTQEAGTLTYFEVCSSLKGATKVWNAPQEVPYAYKGNQWIRYDNPKCFTLKAEGLLKNSFRGAMVWAINLDDFMGTFCGKAGKCDSKQAVWLQVSVILSRTLLSFGPNYTRRPLLIPSPGASLSDLTLKGGKNRVKQCLVPPPRPLALNAHGPQEAVRRGQSTARRWRQTRQSQEEQGRTVPEPSAPAASAQDRDDDCGTTDGRVEDRRAKVTRRRRQNLHLGDEGSAGRALAGPQGPEPIEWGRPLGETPSLASGRRTHSRGNGPSSDTQRVGDVGDQRLLQFTILVATPFTRC